MIDEEAWTEIGSNAHWWGRPKKEMTCKSRENARQSRIDGFLLNKEALPLVHDFYVEKDEMIPTHSCVGIMLSRNVNTETQRFARNLPCLKKLFDQKQENLIMTAKAVADKVGNQGKASEETKEDARGPSAPSNPKKEGEDERTRNSKQQTAFKKGERKQLQEMMDREIKGRREALKACVTFNDVDGMWKMISQCVEGAWLKYLDDSKEMKKKNAGRGEL